MNDAHLWLKGCLVWCVVTVALTCVAIWIARSGFVERRDWSGFSGDLAYLTKQVLRLDLFRRYWLQSYRPPRFVHTDASVDVDIATSPWTPRSAQSPIRVVDVDDFLWRQRADSHDTRELLQLVSQQCIDEKWDRSHGMHVYTDTYNAPPDRLRNLDERYDKDGIVVSTMAIATILQQGRRGRNLVRGIVDGITGWARSLHRLNVYGLLLADQAALDLLQSRRLIRQSSDSDETWVFVQFPRVRLLLFDRDEAASHLPFVSGTFFGTLQSVLPPSEARALQSCVTDALHTGNLSKRRAADLLHVNDLRFALLAHLTRPTDGLLRRWGYRKVLLMDGVDARLGVDPFVVMRAFDANEETTPFFLGYETGADISGGWMADRFRDCYPIRQRPSWLRSDTGTVLYNAGVFGGHIESVHAVSRGVAEFLPCVLSRFDGATTRDQAQRLLATNTCDMMAVNVILGMLHDHPQRLRRPQQDETGRLERSVQLFAGAPFVSQFKRGQHCGSVVYHK
ncbi:MAG: hypothetical protein MHM6MM_001780 [Cercozoa sp. M6MM]